MNTLKNLQRYLKDPGRTEFEQLLSFIEFAGKARVAPTIVNEETQWQFSSFETCSEISDAPQWPAVVAPTQVVTDLLQEERGPQQHVDEKESLAAITDCFNGAPISYLRCVKYQQGIIKRRTEDGLHVINNAFQ